MQNHSHFIETVELREGRRLSEARDSRIEGVSVNGGGKCSIDCEEDAVRENAGWKHKHGETENTQEGFQEGKLKQIKGIGEEDVDGHLLCNIQKVGDGGNFHGEGGRIQHEGNSCAMLNGRNEDRQWNKRPETVQF